MLHYSLSTATVLVVILHMRIVGMASLAGRVHIMQTIGTNDAVWLHRMKSQKKVTSKKKP